MVRVRVRFLRGPTGSPGAASGSPSSVSVAVDIAESARRRCGPVDETVWARPLCAELVSSGRVIEGEVGDTTPPAAQRDAEVWS